MKEYITSTKNKTNITNYTKSRTLRTNVLELNYNNDLEDFIKVVDFKNFKLKQKQDLEKNDDSDIKSILIEDLDLRDILKEKEFPEKDFNIVNKFLRIEEEEIINNNYNYNINLNSNSSQENENENEIKKDDKFIENEDEDLILNQLNNKLFKNDEFEPGLFTSFDFKDKIKALINNSFLFNTKINYNLNPNLTKLNNAFSIDSNHSGDIRVQSDINNSFILDTCFTDKDITYDNIVINFDDDKKKDKKEISISEDKKLEFEFFKKDEAISEYENQIISYQFLNDIQKQQEIKIIPEKDEKFKSNIFEYFVKISKEIKDKGLKNKVKLILKLIMYKDQKTKKYIFNNKTKNQLLEYWKNRYQKELDETIFIEKSKIVQKKIESSNLTNKFIEMSKKLVENKKKSNAKKGEIKHLDNTEQNNIRRVLKKLFTRFSPVNKSINNKSNNKNIKRNSQENKLEK